MGSSAASAAAGAVAVNALFGSPLSKEELILPGLASEATVSGYHADNVAPALLGGFVLVRYECMCLSVRPLAVGTMQISLRWLCLGVSFLSGRNVKKGKENIRPFGVNLMRSQVLYRPAQVR